MCSLDKNNNGEGAPRYASTISTVAFRDDKEVKEKMPFILICVNLEPKNKKEQKKSVFCVILGLFRLCIINARKAPAL